MDVILVMGKVWEPLQIANIKNQWMNKKYFLSYLNFICLTSFYFNCYVSDFSSYARIAWNKILPVHSFRGIRFSATASLSIL